MAAGLPIQIHVDELVSSDLATRLYNNQKPTLSQYSRLAVPGVVKALEKLWHMPITGRVKFFLLNYPAHHYTAKWSDYFSDERRAFELAVMDGYLDVVKDYVVHKPEFLIDRGWGVFVPLFLYKTGERGHIEVLLYLIDAIEELVISFPKANLSEDEEEDEEEIKERYDRIRDRIRNGLRLAYYAAICSTGDMERFEELAQNIIHARGADYWNERYARIAAINGGQVEILKRLNELEGVRRLNILEDLVHALEKGKLEIVKYLLEQYPSIITNDYYDGMLNKSLVSGDPKVINFILKYTKLKFKIEYLPSVLASGNVFIAERFAKQFPKEITRALLDHHTGLYKHPNSGILSFAATHGYIDFLRIMKVAMDFYDFSILDFVARIVSIDSVRGNLKKNKNSKRLAQFTAYLDTMAK